MRDQTTSCASKVTLLDGKKRSLLIISNGKMAYGGTNQEDGKVGMVHGQYAAEVVQMVARKGFFLTLHGSRPPKGPDGKFDLDRAVPVDQFRLGKKETLAGREAQTIEFQSRGAGKEPTRISVWLDTQTQLLLKRVIFGDLLGIKMLLTETYTEFQVDPKLYAKLFALPQEKPAENKKVRVESELTVHGEGSVAGKKTPPNFRLRMEIENLTDEPLALARPTLEAKGIKFLVARWYEEKDDGKAWNGKMKAKEKKTVNVIGDLEGQVIPGKELSAKIDFETLKFEVKAIVKPGLLAKCPCGCDRSEPMIAELRNQNKQVALGAIEKALAVIAERELQGHVTEAMIAHRLRLLAFREGLRGENQ